MLSTLLLISLGGALAVMLWPTRNAHLLRRLAIVASAMVLLCSLWLLLRFDVNAAGIQFYESHVWHQRMGASFALGVNGFSLPLIVLGALLVLVAVLATTTPKVGARLYFSLLLLLETAMLGVFAARDWSLFYVFWELTLIPLFFLINRFGGARREAAALNFVLYTMGGSVFMLIAILLLYDAAPTQTFAMAAVAAAAPQLADGAQLLIFLGLAIGFAVKTPLFPLHGWLPLAHVEAPGPVSILLSGILLKMGAYGLLLAIETLPAAAMQLQSLLFTVACLSMLYGGVLAWRSRDIKEMVAYSSIGHMGVVLFAMASLNESGFAGAAMQMLAHGCVAGMLFLLVGAHYERTGRRDIGDYAALAQVTPRLAFFLVLALTAAVGLPGSVGFIAEVHALVGAFARWGGAAALLSLAMLISAAWALRIMGRLFDARVAGVNAGAASGADLGRAEITAAAALSAVIVIIGVFPAPALALFGASAARLARLFGA